MMEQNLGLTLECLYWNTKDGDLKKLIAAHLYGKSYIRDRSLPVINFGGKHVHIYQEWDRMIEKIVRHWFWLRGIDVSPKEPDEPLNCLRITHTRISDFKKQLALLTKEYLLTRLAFKLSKEARLEVEGLLKFRAIVNELRILPEWSEGIPLEVLLKAANRYRHKASRFTKQTLNKFCQWTFDFDTKRIKRGKETVYVFNDEIELDSLLKSAEIDGEKWKNVVKEKAGNLLKDIELNFEKCDIGFTYNIKNLKVSPASQRDCWGAPVFEEEMLSPVEGLDPF